MKGRSSKNKTRNAKVSISNDDRYLEWNESNLSYLKNICLSLNV